MTARVYVYGEDGVFRGLLENAMDVSYNLKLNDLWTASFSLPSDDPGNDICTPHAQVRIREGARDIGIYRIIAMPSAEMGAGGVRTYSLEHVMATLLDDVLFGYHEIGGEGTNTRQVMYYILKMQTNPVWTMGECDFDDEYQYKFENTSLLSALLSLGNVLTAPFTWVFDTSVKPWRVSLRRAETAPTCGIQYRRNLTGITASWDAGNLVTRLYLLGYGEGVNQLTVRDVNNGLPYIDAQNINFPVKSSVFVDTTIEDAQTLLARGHAMLDTLSMPSVSYTASAIDLSAMTGYDWDTFLPGKVVRVDDRAHDIKLDARIVSVSKSDVRGRPGEVTITIANTRQDTAQSIASIADRVGIAQLYSQGATNIYTQSFADNADEGHPAKMKVYIPSSCVRINQMLLSWNTAAFRTYEKMAKAGGASSSTSGGGGGTQTTSGFGGGAAVTDAARVITQTASTGEAVFDTLEKKVLTQGPLNGSGIASNDTEEADAHTHSLGGHSHGMSHTHTVKSLSEVTSTPKAGSTSKSNTDTASGSTGSAGAHKHEYIHYHNFAHKHQVTVSMTIPPLSIEIPDHTHTVDIPSHTHSVSVPAHNHQIDFGIYEGARASRASVSVDGTIVPEEEISKKEIDIVRYLEKDENGKITRGAWHTIEITPTGLTRIEANLFVQVFVQSTGGGDF